MEVKMIELIGGTYVSEKWFYVDCDGLVREKQSNKIIGVIKNFDDVKNKYNKKLNKGE